MSYKNSKVYQLGYELVLHVETVCRSFPRHEQYSLAQQLRNSSRSIVANYVEGYVRQGHFSADHRRFLIYSQGSCDETKYWLELAKDLELFDGQRLAELVIKYEQLGRMIFGILSKSH